MKLAALCCTYLRPDGLGQLIECFMRQDYPRELRSWSFWMTPANTKTNRAMAGD